MARRGHRREAYWRPRDLTEGDTIGDRIVLGVPSPKSAEGQAE